MLGDLILDRYTWGDAERISQEAPVILLREERREARLGGAANVANMLRGLEADVTLAGVVGDDVDGRELRLNWSGPASIAAVCSSIRSAPRRSRNDSSAGRSSGIRIRFCASIAKSASPSTEAAAQRLLTMLFQRLPDHQSVLISEYGKGVCTPGSLPQADRCRAQARRFPSSSIPRRPAIAAISSAPRR